MSISKQTVLDVVNEASIKMQDPNYTAMMVGGFVQEQGSAAQFLSAHADELGGPEQVVSAIFHAALLGLCFQRANNRSVPEMSFADLDRVSGDALAERLGKVQPALHEYIVSNVEEPKARDLLSLLALAMDLVS